MAADHAPYEPTATLLVQPVGHTEEVSVASWVHNRLVESAVASRRTWPTGFQRNLLGLVTLLCLATVLASGYSLWQLHTLTTDGITTEATALGPATGGPDSGIYVRFLWGSEALIGTAPSPLWEPEHGTRVQVAFLASDPRGSVAIVDRRAGGGYVVPAGAALLGTVCLVAAVSAHRRRQPKGSR